ncbi:hypothetical protein GHT06_012961 [Daphnia sinensis]|uniref:Uncharacterized protein n=1 Tax=Daphnia sinensis TaxID=1820382 RepID=A0AAD5KZ98_9CRUS|nr:hypothetical protein GHT06_012961 [Daphnia sinensis]
MDDQPMQGLRSGGTVRERKERGFRANHTMTGTIYINFKHTHTTKFLKNKLERVF